MLGHRRFLALGVLLAAWSAATTGLNGQQYVLTDVPAHYWYHGCSPTSGMMVLGYWDAYGYPNLIPGSNSWASNDAAIKDAIAGPGHIADYALYGLPSDKTIDSSGLGRNADGTLARPWEDFGWPACPDLSDIDPAAAHPDNCLADFMWTSRSSVQVGSDFLSHGDTLYDQAHEANGIEQYTSWRGYAGPDALQAVFHRYDDFSWNEFVKEIQLGRPVVLNGDFYDQDDEQDHTVCAIGYRTNAGKNEYEYISPVNGSPCEVKWAKWAPMSVGTTGGVHSVVTVRPSDTTDAHDTRWAPGTSGFWSDSANWDNGVPSSDAFVFVPQQSMTFVSGVEAARFVNNYGIINVMGGTLVAGQLRNAGTITGAGLFVGNVTNLGSISPSGSMQFVGGKLTFAAGTIGAGGTNVVINQGNFEWTSGTVQGTGGLRNESDQFTIVGSGSHAIQNKGVLSNAGTITQAAGAVLRILDTSRLDNLAGAVYDIQGDGTVIDRSGTFNNAGLFRKSAGSGTASVSSYTSFNNMGTVEVDSGTLSFSNGSSVNGHYEFANGGRLANGWSSSWFWEGEQTANGNGVLDPGGRVAAGTTATFSSSGFTNGARLEMVSGWFSPNVGGTLIFNFGGGTTAKLAGGVVGGAGTTINQGNFEWTSGTVQGTGGLRNESDQFTIVGSGSHAIQNKGVLSNAGTITQAAGAVLRILDTSRLENLAGAVYDIQGDGTVIDRSGTFNNAGLFRKSAGSGTASVSSYTSFNNMGTVEVDSGTLSIAKFTQTAGATDLNGGTLAFSLTAQILGGELVGSGTINGSVVNSGGLVSPGHSPGTMVINGNYTQGPDGTLLIELAGYASGQFDFLDVNGTASLDGILEIEFLNGFRPAAGDVFHIMDFNSQTGDFASIDVLETPGYQFVPQYDGGSLTIVTDVEAVPEPSSIALGVSGVLSLLFLVWWNRGRTRQDPRSAAGRPIA